MKRLYFIILSALFLFNNPVSGQTGPDCQMIGITEPLNFNLVTTVPAIFPGDPFCLEFQVENFDFVIGFQYTFNFDPTKFRFEIAAQTQGSVTGLISSNDTRADEGILVFIWTNANSVGQSLPDGTGILNICFTAIGEPGTCDICLNDDLAPVLPAVEVNYQIDPNTTCSDTILYLDGSDACSQLTIECEDLTILDVSVCNTNTMGGSLTFSVCGGTPPYNYTLNGAAPGTTTPFTPAVLNNLPAGTYTIEVIDGAGTRVTRTIDITSEDPLAFEIQSTDPSCELFENGTINVLNFSGGTAPYVVTGIQGLTQQGLTATDVAEFERLGNGTYTVTVEDALGCQVPDEVTLFTPPLEIDIQLDTATCVGSTDGGVRIEVSGGVPFPNGQYAFNNILLDFYETDMPFQENNYIEFLEVFRISIQDDSGCPEQQQDIIIPTRDTISYTITDVMDVSCKGDSTGGFVLTDINPGPFNDYFFPLFDELGNLSTAVGGSRNDSLIYDSTLPAGTYTIDINSISTGCVQEAIVTINEPIDSIELTPSAIPPTCGMTDGEATVIAFGGTQPFSYSWADDPMERSNTLTGVAAGMYNVTVTDDLGCNEELSIEVPQGGFIELDAMLTTGLGCDNMGTGELAVTIVNSSTPPISVLWFDELDTNIGSGQMQAVNSPGLYYVEVTSSDCVARDTVEIIPGGGFTFDIDINNPTCPTFNNGSIIVDNFSGGTAPYECSWDPIPFIGCDHTNLSEGTYTLTVRDADGCEVDSMITLTNEIIEISLEINVMSPDCPGDMTGSIEIINITGGQGPYTCEWEDVSITSCNPADLDPGIYNFSVMDANGCMSRDTFAEILPNTNFIDFTANVTNPQCGGALGSIDILSGSGSSITVSWSDPALMGNSLIDLDAGAYLATITDGNGCSIDSTFNLINESDNFDITVNATAPECPDGIDGSISIIGCMGCTCMWEDSSLDAQGCDLVSLTPGFYRVTVTDPLGCQGDTLIDLTVPDALEVTVEDITDTECFQEDTGRATASVVNDPRGVGLYDFIWSNGNTDSDEISATDVELPVGDNFVIGFDGTCTDTFFFSIGEPDELLLDMANVVSGTTSCNGLCDGTATLAAMGGTVTSGAYTYRWDDDVEAETRDDLCAGVNVFTIIDDNGCETIDSVLIEEPDLIAIDTMDLINVSCALPNSGAIRITVDGGCGNYMYMWTGDVSDSNAAENLAEGTYTVTVTDDCGCTVESTFIVDPASTVEYTPLVPDVPNCIGDQVCIGVENVSGGAGGNYFYSVNFGNSLPVDSCFLIGPGVHTISVFDDISGQACATEATVVVEQPLEFSVDLGPDITLNLGAADATLTANVTGGSDPLSYFWNSTSEFECVDSICDMVNVMASTFSNYQVLVVDENGCEATDEINIEVKALRNVYIPNTFSPSTPAPNNKFMVLTGQGVEQLNYFRIFDRWGNLMYEVENIPAPTTIDMGWDGRRGDGANSEVEPGVYVFIAEVQFLDNGNTVEYTGSVTLVR